MGIGRQSDPVLGVEPGLQAVGDRATPHRASERIPFAVS
jgi:hypothetical protein